MGELRHPPLVPPTLQTFYTLPYRLSINYKDRYANLQDYNERDRSVLIYDTYGRSGGREPFVLA